MTTKTAYLRSRLPLILSSLIAPTIQLIEIFQELHRNSSSALPAWSTNSRRLKYNPSITLTSRTVLQCCGHSAVHAYNQGDHTVWAVSMFINTSFVGHKLQEGKHSDKQKTIFYFSKHQNSHISITLIWCLVYINSNKFSSPLAEHLNKRTEKCKDETITCSCCVRHLITPHLVIDIMQP